MRITLPSYQPELLDTHIFGVLLVKEIARSDRTGAPLGLILVRGFASDDDPTRASVGDVSEYVLRRKRITDDVCLLQGNTLAVLLPDTDAEGVGVVANDLHKLWGDISTEVYSYPTHWVRHEDDDEPTESEAKPMELLLAQPLPSWKRVRDIVVSMTGLIVLSPLMLIVALLIKRNSPGPVYYSHTRIGWRGKPFRMYKFRSMVVGAEEQKTSLLDQNEQDGPAFKMTHDPRVTSVGRVLRKLSIDEIPQLFNVLKGDMTLVGPRPLLPAEVKECEPWQKNRLAVVPGITCTWQVQGRSEVSFADWMRMDLRFMKSSQPFRDTRLLLSTVRAVLIRPNGK